LQELLLLPAVVEVVAVAEVWVKFSSSFTTPTSPPLSTGVCSGLQCNPRNYDGVAGGVIE
jgi:hypothetical protein